MSTTLDISNFEFCEIQNLSLKYQIFTQLYCKEIQGLENQSLWQRLNFFVLIRGLGLR